VRPSLNHSILIKLSSRHAAHIGVVHLSDVLPVIKSTIIKLLAWNSSHLPVILAAHHVSITHTTGHHHLILHHVTLLSHRLDYYEVSPVNG
jgi:hypothetical protein